MLNLKSFVSTPVRPVLVGGIGDGGPMDQFHKEWTMKHCHNDVWVVGKRDGSKGCFSMRPLTEGWDIAFYSTETPKEVFDALKANRPLDAEYHKSNPRNKYLALDLLKIMGPTAPSFAVANVGV